MKSYILTWLVIDANCVFFPFICSKVAYSFLRTFTHLFHTHLLATYIPDSVLGGESKGNSHLVLPSREFQPSDRESPENTWLLTMHWHKCYDGSAWAWVQHSGRGSRGALNPSEVDLRKVVLEVMVLKLRPEELMSITQVKGERIKGMTGPEIDQ